MLNACMLISRYRSVSLRARTARLPRYRTLGVFIFGAWFASAPAHAQQASDSQRWVSDTLSTYVRSGPTEGYRIVGTLQSGQPVELITSKGDFSQVRSENGDTVWIPTRELQNVPGHAERVPQLEQRVAELDEQLRTIDDNWKARVQGMQETLDARKTLIDELEARRQQLDSALSQSQSELREAQARLGDENKQVLMRYMVYGGSIAGAGLLLGLILPAMTRGRKRNDRWF